MNRWTQANLLLGALALALLAVLWLPPSSTGHVPLTTLGPDAITEIRIERADRLTLALRRGPDGWASTHPVQRPALQHRVGQLLAISGAPVAQRFAADEGLNRYGLERPKAVLQLNQQRLLFGARDPSQRQRYVLVEDEIRVIDDIYHQLLTLPVRHFVGD